jgi:hypothetical protein
MPDDRKPVIDADAVVLPPEGGEKSKAPQGEDAHDSADASRIVAQWMDELIRIPGTNFRIGLDPIIGLFPGVGDFLASSVGLVTLAEGVRMRVPLGVLFRMGFNILINDAVGTIPGIGDVFSAWFKSNSRNLRLINRWKSGDTAAVRRSGRIFLAAFVIAWLGLMLFWLLLWFTMASAIYHAVAKLFGY